jgi:hypothetical protein
MQLSGLWIRVLITPILIFWIKKLFVWWHFIPLHFMGLTELQNAISNKLPDEIIRNLMNDYVTKRFNNHPQIRDRIIALNNLDPFVGKTTQEKMDLMNSSKVRNDQC